MSEIKTLEKRDAAPSNTISGKNGEAVDKKRSDKVRIIHCIQ